MEYREATVWDAIEVTRLWEKMMVELDFYPIDRLDSELFLFTYLSILKSGKGCIFVAEEGGKLI